MLAENEDSLARMKWPTVAADMGAPPGESAVTISRFTGGNVIVSVFGDSAEKLLPYLGNALATHTGWEVIFTVGMATGTYRPLLVLSPLIAETHRQDDDQAGRAELAVRERAHAGASVREVPLGLDQPGAGQARRSNDWVQAGQARPRSSPATIPSGCVPVVTRPEHIMIAVSGDPLRSNCYLFVHNGMLGFPTTKTVKLPRAGGLAPRGARAVARSRHERRDSLWIVLPAGQQASGDVDRRHAEAARRGARARARKVPLAGAFPRQRVEVIRAPRSDGAAPGAVPAARAGPTACRSSRRHWHG